MDILATFGGGDAAYVGLQLDQHVALGDVVAVGFKFAPEEQVAAK